MQAPSEATEAPRLTTWRREAFIGVVAAVVVAAATVIAQASLDDRRADRELKTAHDQNVRAERLENLRFVRERSMDLSKNAEGEPVHNQFAGFDLTEQNLIGLDLAGDSFVGASLKDAWLISANLERANFFQADLSGAMMWDVNLDDADLSQANLEGANLRNAKLHNVSLYHTRWSGADLRGANIGKVDLTFDSFDQTPADALGFAGTCHDERTNWPEGYVPSPPQCSDTQNQLDTDSPPIPKAGT